MKIGARMAVGVGIGYLLGRTRKMRLALMLAAAGATGTVGSPGELLRHGLKQLSATPELGKLTDVARGQLLDAAKTAAATAASNRIDSLNDRLQGKAIGDRRRKDEDPEDTGDREPDDEDAVDEDTVDDAPARPHRSSPGRATTKARNGSSSDDGESGRATRTRRTPVRRAARR